MGTRVRRRSACVRVVRHMRFSTQSINGSIPEPHGLIVVWQRACHQLVHSGPEVALRKEGSSKRAMLRRAVDGPRRTCQTSRSIAGETLLHSAAVVPTAWGPRIDLSSFATKRAPSSSRSNTACTREFFLKFDFDSARGPRGCDTVVV